jgi:CheY-like chemotaxis protein
MTKKLLGLSRRADLEMAPTDLASVIGDLSSMLRRVLPETIDVQITVAEATGTVNADAGAVEQVLLNLATNARDAMPNGGRLAVELHEAELDETFVATRPWGRPGRFCCIAVSDTGTGMDEETKTRLFEPFFTTKETGAGTGLGMAMVFGLVKQHDGYVDVYSELGVGTTIRLYFPVTSAKVCGAAEDRSEKESRGGSETILIVEDEVALRFVAKRALEQRGYRVLMAADGAEGLELYRADPDNIDLVISDLVMPNMSGGELLEALRGEETPFRFLLASGYADREARAQSGLGTDVPFLRKPWSLNGLLTQVRELLDRPATAHSGGASDDR